MSSFRSRLASLFEGLPPTYWLLFTGTLINRTGGFVIPFLTLYLTSQRGISISQAALTVSLFGAGSFISQLTGGELSDRLGRRPIMLLSFTAAPAIMVTLGLVASITAISLCTFLLGFFTDLYRPAVSAAVADLVPSQSRVRAYGYIYWAINMGAAVAPIIAGFLSSYTYLALFIGDALTTFIYGIIVFFGVRETRPAQVEQGPSPSISQRVTQLKQAPLLLLFSFLALLTGSIYLQGNVTLPVDMLSHGLGPAVYGGVISINGFLVVLTTIPVSHMASNWRRFRAMSISALFLGLGFGFTAFATTIPLFAISVAIWTVGEIIGTAVAPAIIADMAPVESRGLYQGVFGSAWGLSALAGPLLGGWIYQHLGASVLWIGCFGLACLIALSYPGIQRAARHGITQSPAASDI